VNSQTGFWRITFDTNPNDCNLNCIMCEHHSKHSVVERNRIKTHKPKQRMKAELICKILASTRNSPLKEIIPSTMGEPLLYKDFEKIIKLCKQFNVKLNLTTNGTFPIKGANDWAELIVPISSDVKISWNGATKSTQEQIMVGSNFEKGIEDIKSFIRVRDRYAAKGNNRCRVTLQLTFMQSNFKELKNIVKLGIDLGIDRIKGHHLWTHFDAIKILSMRQDEQSIFDWNKEVLAAKKIANEHLLPNGQTILLENFDILSNRAVTNLNGVCPFLGKEAWIAPDGHFSPCCAPDEKRRELGNFGNVNEKNILAIWHSEEYQKLCKNYMENKVCIECNMRRAPDNNCCNNVENRIND
jgi:MoaA/NifB/PqqE/SkfB family radical SAM enzyme